MLSVVMVNILDTLLTTRTPGGYGLTIKEQRSSGHVTQLRVGEPCDPTTLFMQSMFHENPQY